MSADAAESEIEIEIELERTEPFSETNATSLNRSVGALRLTLEEIITQDNESSRQSYLSPQLQDDVSSVSSTFESEWIGSHDNSSCGTLSSQHESSRGCIGAVPLTGLEGYERAVGTAAVDAFSGIEDEEFAKLDRYGFIVVSKGDVSGSRSGLANAELRLDGDDFLRRQRAQMERRKEKEASRALKWLEMLKSLEGCAPNEWPLRHRKFLLRLEKGIPDCLRARVWGELVKARGLYGTQRPAETGTLASETSVPEAGSSEAAKAAHASEDALFPASDAASQFGSLYLRVSGFERQIDLDIERTLRDHVLFKIRYSQAQISLFKILVAYSNLDREVGYCQGMSTVAAFLLLYFDETTAFGALVRLMRRDDLRLFYKTGFPLLFEYFWIQERLLEKFVPELARHFSGHAITTSIYATKWYLTLFLSFPIGLAARIWDLLLFYGVDVLPLVAIALLKIHAKRLCGLPFEQTMQYLNKLADAPQCSEPDQLISMVMRLGRKFFSGSGVEFGPGSCRGLSKYRRDYAAASRK